MLCAKCACFCLDFQPTTHHPSPPPARAYPSLRGFVLVHTGFQAGPGTIAEACTRGLPVILSSFLPGQVRQSLSPLRVAFVSLSSRLVVLISSLGRNRRACTSHTEPAKLALDVRSLDVQLASCWFQACIRSSASAKSCRLTKRLHEVLSLNPPGCSTFCTRSARRPLVFVCSILLPACLPACLCSALAVTGLGCHRKPATCLT